MNHTDLIARLTKSRNDCRIVGLYRTAAIIADAVGVIKRLDSEIATLKEQILKADRAERRADRRASELAAQVVDTEERAERAETASEAATGRREALRPGRHHLTRSGRFQSDRYKWAAAGYLPVKIGDPLAHDLLRAYAERRRGIDFSFADDLHEALDRAGAPAGSVDDRLEAGRQAIAQAHAAIVRPDAKQPPPPRYFLMWPGHRDQTLYRWTGDGMHQQAHWRRGKWNSGVIANLKFWLEHARELTEADIARRFGLPPLGDGGA